MSKAIAKNAKRYARMLFNAVGVEKAEQVLSELMLLNQMVEGSKEIRNFFFSPMIGDDERERGINSLSERAGFSEEVTKFLRFLSEKRGIGALPEIIRHFTNLYLERKNKAKATVIAPFSLDGGFEERLKSSLRKLTGKEIDLEYEVDPELIGGVVVKIGSSMYDTSLRGQLNRLREELSRRV